MPTMPNLIGLNYDAALAAMTAAGVRSIQLGYFQTDPVTVGWIKGGTPGVVVAQNPNAGQALALNSPVTITMTSYPMGVSTDGPVNSGPIDPLFDGSDTPFILDKSRLS